MNANKLKQTLKRDSERYRQGGVIFTYIKRPLFRVVFWYRVVCWLRQRKIMKYTLGLPASMILRHLSYKYGVFINPNIYIGPGLYIEHGGCVYLNAEYIGENFSVFHEVTLGVWKLGKPYVGNNVTIYMGAKVIGKVHLSDNCVIGTCAVVTKDVPLGKTVVGIPAQIVEKERI